jgi:hypothetical protein
MSYGVGEDALLTTVRREGIWNAANTSASDWNILNKGGNRFLVARPGEEFAVEVISISGGVSRTPYTTILEVWRKHTDPKDVRRLEDDVSDTIVQIEAYPFLGKGESGDIQRANVSSGGPVEERWSTAGDGPKWLVQEIVVMWTEERRATLAE